MTERQAETRLRAALISRAETGMSTTDTSDELDRLHEGMRRQSHHRRRRLAAAVVATAAAAAAIGFGVRTISGNSPNRAKVGGTTASQPRLPQGLTAGTFQRSGATIGGQLILNGDGSATLSDELGSNREALSLVRPGVVQFAPPTNRDYCTVIGTYRFAQSGTRLTFTKVSDGCPARVLFLTMAPWTNLTGG